MKEAQKRIETLTNNGDDSEGGILGFRGNTAFYFIFPTLAPAILALFNCGWKTNVAVSSILIGGGLASAFVLGKLPKGFFEDAIDDLINSDSKCGEEEIKIKR